MAKDELKQPSREISLARLQSLMDLVLRNSSSVAAYDPFKEDLKVMMSPLKLVDELLRIINVAGLDSLPRDSTRWGGGGGSHSMVMAGSAQLERSQSMVGSISGGASVAGTANVATSSRDILSGKSIVYATHHRVPSPPLHASSYLYVYKKIDLVISSFFFF